MASATKKVEIKPAPGGGWNILVAGQVQAHRNSKALAEEYCRQELAAGAAS